MGNYILKSDGSKETYSKTKVMNSLVSSGASPGLAEKIMRQISREIKDGMNTDEIYKRARELLRGEKPGLALRYSLKEAIMELGPDGFIFEKYIAKILKEYGYKTRVGEILKGCCVDHEVDVVAERDNIFLMIECKYHGSKGLRSDIKTALYVHSRFVDIEKAFKNENCDRDMHYEGWLVTNTKCTSDAIKYAGCVKFQIIAWKYPRTQNLQYYIESKKLYPVSILSTLTRNHKKILMDSDIITIQDLNNYTPGDLTGLLNTGHDQAIRIIDEIKILLD
ncbi:MAG: restriction endonuclease [Actinobacteria bacterium]|nr:restriction endonuclease [Actinomycetota bacterium]